MPRASAKKPKQRRTTMRTLAQWGNRTLPPERELRVYEFANGTKAKKAGRGAYEK